MFEKKRVYLCTYPFDGGMDRTKLTYICKLDEYEADDLLRRIRFEDPSLGARQFLNKGIIRLGAWSPSMGDLCLYLHDFSWYLYILTDPMI